MRGRAAAFIDEGQSENQPLGRDELAIDALDPDLRAVAEAVTEVQGAARPGIDPAEGKGDILRPESLREVLRIGPDIEEQLAPRVDDAGEAQIGVVFGSGVFICHV